MVDLPGVGANLADHLDVSIQYGSEHAELSHARHQRLDRAAMLIQMAACRQGTGERLLFSVLFHAFDDPALPEIEVFMTPMVIDENLSNGIDEDAPLMQARPASAGAWPQGGTAGHPD